MSASVCASEHAGDLLASGNDDPDGSRLPAILTPYRIVRALPLGGHGEWDYVVPDPSSHPVFISRTNRVMVVDEQTGTLVGTVTDIDGAEETAIATSTGLGVATSGTMAGS